MTKGFKNFNANIKVSINNRERLSENHDPPELKRLSKNFNPDEEIIKVEEEIEWLSYTDDQSLIYEDCLSWIKTGKRKLTIDDESNFCDSKILQQLLNSKSAYDRLNIREMRDARLRSSPYEIINKVFFLNTSAVKMANIDRISDYMFTNSNRKWSVIDEDDLIYFADVCAGPGGFSEYMLWRNGFSVKGFGMTLKRNCDFQVDQFLAGPSENFHTYYGPYDDVREQGNVYLPANQLGFRDLILEHTNGLGVHFMMADGAFSVKGHENIQEILYKRLYLCQCLIALMVVRTDGHFVTSLFDIFTPFSAGLVYLMYRAFESVTIIKPNSSRPANSERFLICKNKKEDTLNIEHYLFYVNKLLLKRDPNRDIIQLVPMAVLKKDKKFFNYLKTSNEAIAKRQIQGLAKIAFYMKEKKLIETGQESIRLKCLEYWNIPTNVERTDFMTKSVKDFFGKIDTKLHLFYDRFKPESKVLDLKNEDALECPYDYYYTIMQYDPSNCEPEFVPTLYLGLGGTEVYRRQDERWVKVDGIRLPKQTVVYAELVTEYCKENEEQVAKKALHIIDAYMIDGLNINCLSLQQRYRKVRSMCRALWGLETDHTILVRSKFIRYLRKNIAYEFDLRPVSMKDGSKKMAYVIKKNELSERRDHESPTFIIPGSIMFLKYTWSPFTKKVIDDFLYVENDGSDIVDFISGLTNKVLWPWYQKNALNFEKFLKLIETQCM